MVSREIPEWNSMISPGIFFNFPWFIRSCTEIHTKYGKLLPNINTSKQNSMMFFHDWFQSSTIFAFFFKFHDFSRTDLSRLVGWIGIQKCTSTRHASGLEASESALQLLILWPITISLWNGGCTASDNIIYMYREFPLFSLALHLLVWLFNTDWS